MDKLEYLNHISSSNRPVKTERPSGLIGLSWPLVLKFLLAFIVIISILAGIIALATNGPNKTSSLTKQIYTRATNLNATITSYNSRLKSSQLRAIGISLSGALTNASGQIATYVSNTSTDKKPLALNATVGATEAENIDTLNKTLEEARLNGLLDRTYATQIQYQVSMLLAMISELETRAHDNSALLSILQNFNSSLSAIEQSFENYSNPGD